VLFGEVLPDGAFEKAELKARDCELFFVIGTSAMVYPAAALPMIAKRAGAFVVEINPELTDISNACDLTLQGKAGEILPLIGS
jgi:NAD-dependent deacetylase